MKHLEESPGLSEVDTNAVVADGKLPLGVCAPGRDMHLRRCRRAYDDAAYDAPYDGWYDDDDGGW